MCFQKEGLAQKYASLHLPKSAYYPRQGVLVQFCRHDACAAIKGVNYGQLRLAIPISDIISYCEASWEKNIGNIDQRKNIVSCNGKSYEQPIRRILSSEGIGIVALGHLKVSVSSGRLQLLDATGAVDVMFKIPPNWKFENIFEAKDFTIIMQGIAPKLVDMRSAMDPLSCRSILGNTPVIEKTKMSLYLCGNLGSDNSPSFSPFNLEDYTQKLANGKYKLLVITHKFPIQQKFEGDRANRFNMFAETIFLPWSLLLPEGPQNANMRDSLQDFATSEEHALRKCKVGQGFLSVSSRSYSHAEDISCFSSEFPCLIAHRNLNHHISGTLHCTTKSRSRRLLLEFDPNSFCTYEFLKIGGYYLLKEEEDKPVTGNGNHRIFRDKVFVGPETNLWSFVFSSLDSLHNSHSSKACNEIIPMSSVLEVDDITSRLKLYLPSSALSSLADVIKILNLDHSETTEPSTTRRDTPDSCSGPMMIMQVQSFGTSCPQHELPVGDLVSLHGLVTAIHDTVTDDFPANSSLPMFLRRDNNVCIHVLVDNNTVKVFGNLCKRAHPLGLGPDVYATFHRVLKPRGHGKYTLTPASSITVNHTSSLKNQCIDECNYPNKCLPGVTSPNANPTTSLISNVMQPSEPKTMQLRGRVVSVYIVVLEKIGTRAFSRSSSNSISSALRIPFAGFVLDDGSPSCCCCWAESQTAATLLGLELDSKDENALSSPSRTKTSTTTLQEKTRTACRLNRILEQHGRVVIKNYGSPFDSSDHNIELSFGSEKLVAGSDVVDFLRDLMINASSLSSIWTVNARFMDESATKWLRRRLTEVDVTMPSMCNLQTTRVRRADILEEARDLFSELSNV